MPDLLASLSAPPSGRSRPVWFDSLAYCRAKLLADGPLPWAAPGELGAFTAKAQGMFGSDALLVDIADLCASRVGADPELRAAMGLRSRAGYRSEEHTSELQSHLNLVCRLLLEKKKKI